MKWFKHFSDALDDPFTQELILKFGPAGYLAWFGLLELAAKQMKPDALDYKFEFSPTFLKQKFHISPGKLQEIFRFCSGKVRLFFDFSGENWKFEIPKLLELKDNYSKDLQGTGKKLSHHKELRAKSKILEEDKDTIPPASRERVTKPTKEPDPRIKQVIDYAFNSFQEKFHHKLPISGSKDGANIQRLLGQFDPQTIQSCWDYYISANGSHGKWFYEQGHTISNFCSDSNFAKCLEGASLPGGIDAVTARNLKNKQLFIARMEKKYAAK